MPSKSSFGPLLYTITDTVYAQTENILWIKIIWPKQKRNLKTAGPMDFWELFIDIERENLRMTLVQEVLPK